MIVTAFKRIRSGVAGRLALLGASLLLGFGQGAWAFNYQQNFETWASAQTPPSGWAIAYNNSPNGDQPQWFQGNAGGYAFDAQSGTPNSFAAAMYNATVSNLPAPGGVISTWIFTPELVFNNGDTVSFWTISATPSTETYFQDSMEARLSTNGASTNIGSTSSDVGDFSTLLQSVNSDYIVNPGQYPDTWAQYNVTISGLAGPTNGRIGFRYYMTGVTNDPATTQANYIGLDTFATSASIPPPPVPEPSSLALIGIGLAGLAYRRHRSKKQG